MTTPLVVLLVDVTERALDRALGALASDGYPGLSPSHALAVQLVEAGVATTRDLAVAMRMTPQAVSAIVDQLEARGFVVRRRQERDARAKVITLTDKGHRLASAVARALSAVEEDWAEAVRPERVSLVRDALVAYVASDAIARPEGERPRRRRVRIS
jgi:DNA-binding MarR family transcriptional regulator